MITYLARSVDQVSHYNAAHRWLRFLRTPLPLGASPLLRAVKEARKGHSKGSRPRRRFKAQEPQRLTTSVVVLCAALYSLISSDDVDCRMSALELLRAANECFAFGLSTRSLRLDGEQ